LAQNTAKLCKNWILAFDLKTNAIFGKNTEISDHNIDPRSKKNRICADRQHCLSTVRLQPLDTKISDCTQFEALEAPEYKLAKCSGKNVSLEKNGKKSHDGLAQAQNKSIFTEKNSFRSESSKKFKYRKSCLKK
jgi:hypothetical protein